jgi:DNA helicase HerA-like ATPase
MESEDRKIGFVASGSTVTYAYILLIENREDEVKEESFAYVVDRGDKVFGILRSGRGVDENLKTGGYSPGIAYAKKGLEPSSSRRSFSYVFSVIGRVHDNVLKGNRLILVPGSPVYTTKENPFKSCVKGIELNARDWEMPWKIRFDETALPQHLLVVGSTGSGKSCFVRYVVFPLMASAGYSCLAFDWHGFDYAPYVDAEHKMDISEIRFDAGVVARAVGYKARYFGFSSYENVAYRTLREALEGDESWREKAPGEIAQWITDKMAELIGEKQWPKYQGAVERGLAKLSETDWKKFLGKINASEVIAKAREKKLLVMDMGGFTDDEKLNVFYSIGNEVKNVIGRGEKLNLGIVIDEAPQYAPYSASEGIQKMVKELISDLAATGRKYGLSLVLIAQGIAGEIGIDPAIRRNLNTHFFGRLMPQDKREVETMLEAHHIFFENILRLEPGQFYFEGRGNPFPTPLLITFDME